MSETASDAWSTDVLASDTSERQADRLLELDQVDAPHCNSRAHKLSRHQGMTLRVVADL